MASSAPDSPQTSRVLEHEPRFGAEACAELPVTGPVRNRPWPAGRPSPGPGTVPPVVAPLPGRAGPRPAVRPGLDTRAVPASVPGAVERIPAPVVRPDLSCTSFPGTGAAAADVATGRAPRAGARRLVAHRPPRSPERVAALFPRNRGDVEAAT